MLVQVPFLIVVNTSRFTTPENSGIADGPGVSIMPSFNILQSLTFAVMPDDEMDKGILSWMNIQLPGFEGVFKMPRKFFLICEPLAAAAAPTAAAPDTIVPRQCSTSSCNKKGYLSYVTG